MAVGFGKVIQVAYLVEDMDEAMEHWVRQLGVGPWTCIRDIRLEAVYDGVPIELAMHEGLSYVGELQIQLVEPLEPDALHSPYRAFVEAGRWGMHHMAFFSEDIERDVERAVAQGFERTCEMRSKDGHRYFYLRSKAMPEVWIEFLEVYPLLTEIFRDGIAAAASWDGSNPVRNVEYSEL